MTALTRVHVLTWRIELTAEGFTVHELLDEMGRRWGWIINAAASGWAAHVGDFGQADAVGMRSPPVPDLVEHHDELGPAKLWVEQEIADRWRRPVVVPEQESPSPVSPVEEEGA